MDDQESNSQKKQQQRFDPSVDDFVLCPECDGVGAIHKLRRSDEEPYDLEEWVHVCGFCKGTGLQPKAKFCPTCRGKGYLLDPPKGTYD